MTVIPRAAQPPPGPGHRFFPRTIMARMASKMLAPHPPAHPGLPQEEDHGARAR
jgi:hypothetical protein